MGFNFYPTRMKEAEIHFPHSTRVEGRLGNLVNFGVNNTVVPLRSLITETYTQTERICDC
ncbi:unnamed protein product [Prunus armeniaca]|uniref:Uncharacterized protein n=1 Tax=Prunus armeniaca TaxID=36596 RepID=A0A6J5U2F6_PRUAR|nr:unnamed protein product [Prunus armeniaca]